jgi:pimeloyl-ACP methyl ester carboxylesterase
VDETVSCTADDGTPIVATATGSGRPLILLAGGIDYRAGGWDRVVPLLTGRHRVVRYVRRFYRPELGDPFRWAMSDEAGDVAALARRLGGSVDLLGHSSGGVVALESLARDADLYGSAVVFEAPIVLDRPLGGAALDRARASLSAGRPARSMTIFFHDVVGLPSWSSRLGALGIWATPAYRRRIPGQLADLAAIDALGDRRRVYAGIARPLLVIRGTTSPAHLGVRMRALAEVVPNARSWVVEGGHAAQQRRPERFAEQILAFLADATRDSS